MKFVRYFLVSPLLFISLIQTGCKSNSFTSDFYGLSLGERYSLSEAIGILHNNTHVSFEIIDESPYLLKGQNVSFAGNRCDAYFGFDYKNRLNSVVFIYLTNGLSSSDKQQALSSFNDLLKSLTSKYGKSQSNYNNGFWRNREQAISLDVGVDNGHYITKLHYYLLDSGSASDML